MHIRRGERVMQAVIPTASMADIAFLLIIFFMVTTAYSLDRTPMELPQTQQQEQAQKGAAIIAITEDEVFEDVKALAQRLGKQPVVVGDKAGFIANALLFGYLNHAVSMYESRYATREDLDAAMRFGCGYPMGPLALLDLIGLETAYEILDTMYKQGRNRLHAPSPIIKQMVSAGLLGRKSGRGFHQYS